MGDTVVTILAIVLAAVEIVPDINKQYKRIITYTVKN